VRNGSVLYWLLLASVVDCAAVCAAPSGFSKKTYTYKRVGALEINADVFSPATGSVHPAILWIDGGAFVFGDRTMLPGRTTRVPAGALVP